MNDTALPTLKQTAIEFFVSTHHQPLYRLVELLVEREQSCIQIGYDRAIAELTDKLFKQEQVGVAQTPATPLLDSAVAHSEQLKSLSADDVAIGLYVTWFDKDKCAVCAHKNLVLKLHPARSRELFVQDIEQAARDIAECEHDQDYSSFELLVEHIAELAGDGKLSAIRGELRRARTFFTSEPEKNEPKPATSDDSTTKPESALKTLEGDGATSDAINAARPTQRANDIGKLIDWCLDESVSVPVGVKIAAQRLRNNPAPGDGRLEIPKTRERARLNLPARRKQLEIMLSRMKQGRPLSDANVESLVHAVLQLIVLQGF